MLDFLLNITRRLPKPVDRKTHAALDYLTISAFMLMGAYFWDHNKRAAATALTNGFMVLGVSMFTDYPGSAARLISFKTHGKLDLVQAATAATMPALLGFGDDAAALPFRIQAVNELAVVGITDWDSDEGATLVSESRGRYDRVA